MGWDSTKRLGSERHCRTANSKIDHVCNVRPGREGCTLHALGRFPALLGLDGISLRPHRDIPLFIYYSCTMAPDSSMGERESITTKQQVVSRC